MQSPKEVGRLWWKQLLYLLKEQDQIGSTYVGQKQQSHVHRIEGKLKLIREMVSTRATHNYLASTEMEWLGLVIKKFTGRIKAINSTIQPIIGVVKRVTIKTGSFTTLVHSTD